MKNLHHDDYASVFQKTLENDTVYSRIANMDYTEPTKWEKFKSKVRLIISYAKRYQIVDTWNYHD